MTIRGKLFKSPFPKGGFRGIIKAIPGRFSLFQSPRNFYQHNFFGGTGVPPVQAQAEACGYRLTSFPRTPDRRLGIDNGGSFTDLVFLGAGEGRVHMPFYYGPDLEVGFAFHGLAPRGTEQKIEFRYHLE